MFCFSDVKVTSDCLRFIWAGQLFSALQHSWNVKGLCRAVPCITNAVWCYWTRTRQNMRSIVGITPLWNHTLAPMLTYTSPANIASIGSLMIFEASWLRNGRLEFVFTACLSGSTDHIHIRILFCLRSVRQWKIELFINKIQSVTGRAVLQMLSDTWLSVAFETFLLKSPLKIMLSKKSARSASVEKMVA